MIALKNPLRQTAGKEINFPSLVESLAAQARNDNRKSLELLGSALILWSAGEFSKTSEIGNNPTASGGYPPHLGSKFRAHQLKAPGAKKKMIMKKFVSCRMAEVRRAKRLTQFELARRVGCSESQVSKIETGRVTPAEWLKAAIGRELGLQTWEVGV